MDLRHEWKHIISYADREALRARLRLVMSPDPHGIDGIYGIRSLYFDDLSDSALREKLDGVNCREKFRLRCYNGDRSLLLLEKKSKRNGLCAKAQLRLTEAEAAVLAAGQRAGEPGEGQALLRELYCKMSARGLRPKTITDYTREAFVFAPGNVRVTLDYGIRTGISCTDFLDPDCVTVPVREDPVILEVKWDAFLPSVIRDAVQLPGCRSTAFSKYAACRIYG